MRILITGGSGFVGKAYYKFFEHQKHDIVNVDIKMGTIVAIFLKNSSKI